MSENKLYSVVFKCEFVEECFCLGDTYRKLETDFFSMILTADSFSIALDRALDYASDEFSNCDVTIKSIVKL